MVKKSDLLKTKTDRPLRIFISYGHPDAEICMRIRNVLCTRGHEVWFDLDDIKTGDDWRRSITEGIRQSQSVLSMLSRHSVRDPGVCLDEMRIAIGIRGGNIRTILLEPEGRVEPPATLSDRQWLDMSDWKQKKEDRAWFEEKMLLLISAIESPENVRFAGEIERIRRALPDLRYDTSRQSALLRQPFYGRTWLVEKINAWRMDPQGARMCILYGDPGIGKSAFAAYYTHYFVYGAAAVFCEFSRPGFNDPRAVIQTLAYLLACRFPDYRLLLCDLLEESSLLSSMNASEQFDLLIANPFSSILIDGGRGAQCIVIDGLDECGTAEKNVVTEVLVQYADRLPDWLRVLATSRRVAGVTGPASGTFHIDMHGDDRENIRDVEEFFQRQLVPSVTSEICSSLARKSGGIFLYAVMMLDAVRRGRLDPSHPEIFPEGLGSAFFRWFQWFFPDIRKYEECCEPVLSMILASPEPLPADEIPLVMRWTRKKTADILRQFSVLLKREEDGNGLETIAFSHKYIADWLCSRDAGVWQADPAGGAAAMAEAFFEICREDAEDLSDFEALQLRFFLEKSGRKKELRALKGNVRLLRRLLETGLRCAYAEEHEKALRYLREAAVWGEEIPERNLEELDTDPGLEEALHLTGEIYRELGIELEDYGNAENLEKALKCCEKFRQAAFSLYSWKKNEAYTLMYASALGQTGDAYRRYGTKECLRKAIVWFQKREAMILPLLRDHPTAKVRGAVVSVSHQLLKTYMELGEEENLKKALQYAEICIQQTESLNEPETADSLCDKGYACLWMGGVQLARKKTGANTLPAAGQAFESAVRNFEKADRMEHSMKNSRALAQGLFRLGEVYTEIGTPEKRRAAVDVYVKCREIGNELWEQNPTPDRLRELALAWRALGTAWQRLDEEGALEHARSCLEQGLQCSLRLTSWVDTIQYRRDLAISYGRLGEIMERTAVCKADLQASLAQHETCLEILRSIPAKRHTGPVLFETAACEERIGDFLVRHSAGEEGERKEEHDGEGVARNAADHYRSALTLLKDSDLPQKPEMTGRIQKKLTEITDRTDGTTARA